MAQFFYLSIPEWFKGSTVLSGGTVSFFIASTSTPQNVYSDATGGTSLGSVVTLDSNGQAQIWLAAAAYKFILKDSGGTPVLTVDSYNPTNVNTTVGPLTDTGDLTMQQSTAATSGANQSSNNLKVQGRYWTGAADATDQWQVQDVVGTGSNPTNKLSISHSGSTGQSSVNLPSIPLQVGDGTVSVPGYSFNAETNTGFFRQAANVIGVAVNGVLRWLINTAGLLFGSGQAIGWSSNTDPSAAGGDVFLNRQAANTLGIGTTTSNASGTLKVATIQSASVTGAASGNSITLLSSQDTLGSVTGNGTDQNIYTFTIPANTIQAGKGFRIRAATTSNNAVAVTYKLKIGSTTITMGTNGASASNDQFTIEVFNNSGVQNAQTGMFFQVQGNAIVGVNSLTAAENFVNAIAVSLQANEANPNTVTPKKCIFELIQ